VSLTKSGYKRAVRLVYETKKAVVLIIHRQSLAVHKEAITTAPFFKKRA
jgi:hypothetical protein